MTKSRKGQVALEALVVFGILIIGVVIFGLFFMGNIKEITTTDPGTKQDKNTGGDIYDTLEGSLIYDDEQQIGSSSFGLGGGTSSGGTGGTGGSGDDDDEDGGDETPTCGNGVCDLDLGETLLNCPQDCTGGYGSFCGDGICDDGENCPEDCGVLEFVSVWDTTETSSGSSLDNQISLPLLEGGSYDFNVDWGDGTTSNITQWNQPQKKHTYPNSGIYTVKITGQINGFNFFDAFGADLFSDNIKLIEISNWGPLNLGNTGNYFFGTVNLKITASDVLDLNGTTNLSYMFSEFSFSTISNIESWDVSNVTNMSSMFSGASSFNQSLNNWDVSNVTDMSSMFQGASSFNQSLNNWDVSNVTDISYMFSAASSFNQPLNNWDVSNVTSMQGLFWNATSFNGDVSSWNISNVIDMTNVFYLAESFNQPLNNWDVSNVTNMTYMLMGASLFNQPLNNWDVSNVTQFYATFRNSSFNQDIGDWNVSNALNMTDMFREVTLSTSNYDSLLVGWSSRPVQPNVIFNAGNSKYSASKSSNRNTLTTPPNSWTITDGGMDK